MKKMTTKAAMDVNSGLKLKPSFGGRTGIKLFFSFLPKYAKMLRNESTVNLKRARSMRPAYFSQEVDFKRKKFEYDHDYIYRPRDVPKGHSAVYVGNYSERHRVVVPISHFNHPLFKKLLQDAENEFGFDHEGPITIPCDISRFYAIQRDIDSFR